MRAPWADYRLLDFGHGRKLERFGAHVLDRPAPAAERCEPKLDSAAWRSADARYDRTESDQGQWIGGDALPEWWTVEHGGLQFEIKPTPFGHVGLFPEQAANWAWIDAQIRQAGKPLKILNLFAYTGASTLAAARAGAQVVHVDSARGTVEWARQNAALCGLADAPIRWIVEDALKFARREVKRGNQYDAVILDPPSYGHGPAGEAWKIDEHLPELLSLCAELTATERRFTLLTCHSPGYGPRELQSLLQNAFGVPANTIEAAEMALTSDSGHELPAGSMARWSTAGRPVA